MSIRYLFDKFKEVLYSVLPVCAIVLVLFFTVARVDTVLLLRFLIGAGLIVIGLGVFLWGAELAIEPIGSRLGENVGQKEHVLQVVGLGFFLGFIITVAEPDLLIFANQVSDALSGSLSSGLIVMMVSVGVGLMVSIGFLRILLDRPLKWIFLISYVFIFVLFYFVHDAFRAISFDASGATTGAMTTPFLLALCVGISTLKGSTRGEKDAFGLVGIASAGPIVTVMILALIKRPETGATAAFVVQEGLWTPFVRQSVVSMKEGLMALLPVCVVYFFYQWRVFKERKRTVRKILFGLMYTYWGLVIFLTGVNGGFMDLARLMGREMARQGPGWLLPTVGFVLGMVVVLAEPAVYILSNQVENVTGGSINRRMISLCLSLGVALAVMLSMLRIQIPALKLWMYLVPGFVFCLIMAFVVPDIFVGIAFDSGGVASGPMTATFILALTQGAAESIPTADLLVDGFGVIAAVAMMPIFCIMILGLIYRAKLKH